MYGLDSIRLLFIIVIVLAVALLAALIVIILLLLPKRGRIVKEKDNIAEKKKEETAKEKQSDIKQSEQKKSEPEQSGNNSGNSNRTIGRFDNINSYSNVNTISTNEKVGTVSLHGMGNGIKEFGLVLINEETGEKIGSLSTNGKVLIGRLSPSQLILEDKSVSGEHCEIYRDEGVYFLKQIGGSNPTVINNRKTIQRGGLSQPVENGDRLTIGRITYGIRISES